MEKVPEILICYFSNKKVKQTTVDYLYLEFARDQKICLREKMFEMSFGNWGIKKN